VLLTERRSTRANAIPRLVRTGPGISTRFVTGAAADLAGDSPGGDSAFQQPVKRINPTRPLRVSQANAIYGRTISGTLVFGGINGPFR
jgi:hypothetical protein